MQSRNGARYCRYHDVPQRKPAPSVVRTWLRNLVRPVKSVQPMEGRKRILPGYENTNLGAGWNIAYPGEKGRKPHENR